ncbi:hypothetical protein CkaCkLH20_00572 [Colletotrichum karsti]|uniref:Uncharacterized protein n=1 Tax=Colletotrichum karsti TaxID=1095194 RepID=A0A9P6IG64_9PEZI|nr:uncharacterized protein CkaCkLH20_00572 [Colletotrichum karsti]KAF9881426.1 hypothetical protein CkaCkLH20_00572 [Colletotrichum karsti]
MQRFYILLKELSSRIKATFLSIPARKLTNLTPQSSQISCSIPTNKPEHLFHQTIQNPPLSPPSPTDFLLEWDALHHIPSRTLPQTLLLLKHLAEDHTSAPVRFAVLVVPHKPSNADRWAIQNAAHAIGLWAVRVYTTSQAARFSSCVSQRAERGLNEVVFRSRWSDVSPECRGEVELDGVDRAVLGAAVVASVLEPEVYFDLQALPLPHTVVDRTVSWVGLGGQKNRVIQRNQPVPARKNVVLTTAIDDQRRAIIPIIQGQAEEVLMNDEVVVLKLDCIPALPRGTARIKVTVDVTEDPDANKRVLKATAYVIGSDASCYDEVLAVLRDYNSSTELSQAELDAEIRYMEDKDVDPRGICIRTRSPVEYDHLVPFEDSV